MHKYLNKPTDIPFSRLFLDPNNPRTAPEDRPGYEDPNLIFSESAQKPLILKLEEFPEVAMLEPAIVPHGWTPIDPMLV
jgi:hypothetical protein